MKLRTRIISEQLHTSVTFTRARTVKEDLLQIYSQRQSIVDKAMEQNKKLKTSLTQTASSENPEQEKEKQYEETMLKLMPAWMSKGQTFGSNMQHLNSLGCDMMAPRLEQEEQVLSDQECQITEATYYKAKDNEESMLNLMPAWLSTGQTFGSNMQHLNNLGCDMMAPRLEQEEQELSDQDCQITEATYCKVKENEESMVNLMPAWLSTGQTFCSNMQVDDIQCLDNQGSDMMAPRLEAEKQELSEQDSQIMEATYSKAEFVPEQAPDQPLEQKKKRPKNKGGNVEDAPQERPPSPTQTASSENSEQEKEEHNEENMGNLMPASILKGQTFGSKTQIDDLQLLDNQGLEPEKQELSEQDDKITEATNSKANTAKILQNDNEWQRRYEALQENFREEMALKEQSWETKVKQLEEEKKKLAEKEQSWEAKLKELEEEKKQLATNEQSLKTRVKLLEERKEELLKKGQMWETKIKQLEEEEINLAEEEQSCDEKLKQEGEEKNDLEDLCVEMKKKKKKKGHFQFFRKLFRSGQQKEVEKEDTEVKDVDDEMNEKEKELKEETTTTEKKKKKKKSLINWMKKKVFRRRTDSNSEVKETAGCSAQVEQQ